MYLPSIKRAVLAAATTLSLTGVAGAVPAAHAAPIAPQQLGAAQALIGQQTTACYGSYRFDVQVQDASLQRAPVGHVARGNSNWALVAVNATNLRRDTGILAEVVELRDERGRTFHPSTDVAITMDFANYYGVKAPYDYYQPGITETALLAFEVAPDAQRLRVASSNFQCRA